MDLERYRLEAWQAGGDAAPLAFVDLDRIESPMDLPPVPVLALGQSDHPCAAHADIVMPDEESLMTVAANILANPRAAAVTVQLLRLVERLDNAGAQLAESLAYGMLQGGTEHARWLGTRIAEASAASGEVLLARDGDRLEITLNRPDARNAIDRPMRDALREAFDLVVIDESIESVRLQGAGKAFCVGADLGEFGTTRDPALAHAIRMATLPAHAIARCADRFEAHVQGACVGAGLEMAAYAARITATTHAWFQLPELAMGLLPGAGGSVSVTRRIGRHRAGWMMLSGKRVNARIALEWGLVDALVED